MSTDKVSIWIYCYCGSFKYGWIEVVAVVVALNRGCRKNVRKTKIYKVN